MRINSVPDVKCFCNNKNVLRAQSIVWHFVRHPVFAPTFQHVLQFTLLNFMFSEFQAYWPKVHTNMYLRHVVITIQAADDRSYILPNPSLLAFTVISPHHPSVAGWNDKTTTSIIQREKPTEKLVNDKAILSPRTYDRSGHVVRLASLLALLYIHPPTLLSTHSLAH